MAYLDDEELDPEQQKALYESLSAKYTQPEEAVEYNPSALAGQTRFNAALGSGIDDIIKGTTGFESSDKNYYSDMAKSANDPVKYDMQKKKMLNDYLSKQAATKLTQANRAEDVDLKKKQIEATFSSQSADRANKDRHYDLDVKKFNADKTKDDAKALEDKQKPMLEIETRAKTIKNNIDILRKMIQDKGTYETAGAHNDIMDATSKDIAVDLAKLKDPTSSAMTGEVEREMKNLVQSGMLQKNSTALSKLDALESRLQERVKNAYDVRKITPPVKTTEVPPPKPPVIQNGHTYYWNEEKGKYE